MERLIEAAVELVSDTPPARIASLARALRNLSGPQSMRALDGWSATPRAKTALANLGEAWQKTSVTPAELSAIVMAAGAGYIRAKSEQEIELVWTGPASYAVATRKTEQALIEVIDKAKERLFITSFVVYDIALIVNALSAAIRRGVRVSILLEAKEGKGGQVSIDGIARMKAVLPSAKLYSWIERTPEFLDGKVHAKVAVADETYCFISSANLTAHAMERNMEAGVKIRGGDIPARLHRHLEALATANVITSV